MNRERQPNILCLLAASFVSLSLATRGNSGYQSWVANAFSTSPNSIGSRHKFKPWSPHSKNVISQPSKAQTQTYSKTNPFRFMSSQEKDSYSIEIRLREEAESPFRKVRFFLYLTSLAGAFTSFLVSASRIAAALSGVNVDLMEESLINAGVDAAVILVVGVLFQRDRVAQESRYKRAKKGAEFANLTVRGGSFLLGSESTDSYDKSQNLMKATAPLSALRRGRGIEKRVVIAAAGQEKISNVLQEAWEIKDSLSFNDLLIVPVVLPSASAPTEIEEWQNTEEILDCIAFPTGGSIWKNVMSDESEEAIKQGVDVMEEGMCIILKKNGRVGQRTKGIFLSKMCGEVDERRSSGMDVTNI